MLGFFRHSMSKQRTSKSELLRAIPSVDALLKTAGARALRDSVGAQHLTRLARTVTEELRASLLAGESVYDSSNGNQAREALLEEAARRLERACQQEKLKGVRHVINASGVVIHTNLGRAPLSEAARRALTDEAARYCTLEYDLETGERWKRGARVEQLLTDLTGAE